MCWGCTKRITTGERHIVEHILAPRECFAKEWKDVPSDTDAVEASILLPFRPVCGLFEPHSPAHKSAQVRELYGTAEKGILSLIEIYNSEPLQLERLFSLRHPLREEVPYFRQILPIKGGILIGNAFGFPRAGTVKLLGSPERLAEIVQRMLEIQLKPGGDWQSDAKRFIHLSKFWLDDAQMMEKMLLNEGIVKVMKNYVFVVANLKEFGGNDCFCATDSPKMVAEALMRS